MLAKTHIAFGLLISLVLFPFIGISCYVFFPLVVLFSVFPDIDSPSSLMSKKTGIFSKPVSFFTKHRGIFHSLWILVLLSGVVWYFFGRAYGLPIALGYFSHLLIDGMTKAGVNFLHPFGTLRLQGFVETGSLLETVIFIILVFGVIAKVLPFF